MRASQKQFFEKEYFQAKATEKPEADPFDYKDLVPEVVVIPQDTIREAPAEIPAEEEETETATPDTAAKSGTEEIKTNESVPAEKAAADSSSDAGGGQNGEGDTAFIESSKSFRQINNVPVSNFFFFSDSLIQPRIYRSFIES